MEKEKDDMLLRQLNHKLDSEKILGDVDKNNIELDDAIHILSSMIDRLGHAYNIDAVDSVRMRHVVNDPTALMVFLTSMILCLSAVERKYLSSTETNMVVNIVVEAEKLVSKGASDV